LSTKLRILLDENVTARFAALIDDLSALNIVSVAGLGIAGANDDTVVRSASKLNRIVLTTEKGITHKTFPPCTHAGIIVLACATRYEPHQAAIFRRFILSGKRSESRDAVTYLTEREVRVNNHSGHHAFPLP